MQDGGPAANEQDESPPRLSRLSTAGSESALTNERALHSTRDATRQSGTGHIPPSPTPGFVSSTQDNGIQGLSRSRTANSEAQEAQSCAHVGKEASTERTTLSP
eukprot:CAMPEP_0198362302 /NCGR_PEP_ID=MMETSP1450-20131203/145571_1 /TAXON_ID=753684 ORGANISM="Madagascaria erythrocladiodes, Strain CCMP3234" /NCGR_SAMPLE_ID=MMETSP1450 /ASSEMBLY_ACC=CAM_ASM_001115 /LENGTH=103 /DNA_ID=CAMNT_0044069505 /DNA_START=38 /DNA_END=346 /DNA_ORIENTATION=+